MTYLTAAMPAVLRAGGAHGIKFLIATLLATTQISTILLDTWKETIESFLDKLRTSYGLMVSGVRTDLVKTWDLWLDTLILCY